MKVAVILANGFEEVEALLVVDVLRRLDIHVDTITINKDYPVKSSRNVTVLADKLLDNDIYEYDMIILPGGMPGATNMRDDCRVIEALQYFDQENKYIGAICAAPICLSKAGIHKNKNLTSYPAKEFEDVLSEANYLNQAVVIDGKLITSQGPATTFEFAFAIANMLGKDTSSLKQAMLYSK
ncbi:DJ-1 family glyoxalase III [Tannockella kyphosi]|uniref:DJ-1 family glyoxalase III n=1 Tax=Tannockella kyphosi TaxID=2899121 RepID=UPI0020131A95|nr:DJ-1 family glyoxalase III [Tannockella kyphosi]